MFLSFMFSTGSIISPLLTAKSHATSIGSGTFDDLTFEATTVDKHICVADKGVYYSLNDGLPQFEKW